MLRLTRLIIMFTSTAGAVYKHINFPVYLADTLELTYTVDGSTKLPSLQIYLWRTLEASKYYRSTWPKQ